MFLNDDTDLICWECDETIPVGGRAYPIALNGDPQVVVSVCEKCL